MKKKILKLSLALAVVAAAGYTAYSSQTEVQLNGAVLENVEAIANGEAMEPCFGYGTIYCPYNGFWVYSIG